MSQGKQYRREEQCTDEWELQLLSWVSMFDNQLTEGLADTVLASVLRNLVEVVIGQVELVLRLRSINSWPFAWTYFLGCGSTSQQ